MLKIRRPLGRLIFNMGIAIPGKTVFLIETAPSASSITGISTSGGCLNIKMMLYQHRDSHHKDKMVWWPTYLYYENPYIWKYSLYIETGHSVMVYTVVISNLVFIYFNDTLTSRLNSQYVHPNSIKLFGFFYFIQLFGKEIMLLDGGIQSENSLGIREK